MRTLRDLMGSFKTLDPTIALQLLEGYEDAISAAVNADEAYYRQFTCPSCSCTSMSKEFLGGPKAQGTTWVSGEITPQALLRCQRCKLLLNPRSGIILETGNHTPVLDVTDLR